MTNPPPWGALDTSDKLDLAAVKTDIALIKATNDEQNRSLGRIEGDQKAKFSSLEEKITSIPAMIAEMRVGLNGVEKRVIALETRGELDTNKIDIAKLNEKVTKLDTNMETLVIKAGPFRIRAIEILLYSYVSLGTLVAIWALLWPLIKVKLGLL